MTRQQGPPNIDRAQLPVSLDNNRVVRVAAQGIRMYDTGPEGGELVHWRVALIVIPQDVDTNNRNGMSVVVDNYQYRKPNPTVSIELVKKTYATSSETRGRGTAPIYFDIPAQMQFTVNNVYELLVNQKLGNYRYDQNNSGCLYWTATFIGILEKFYMVEAGSFARFVHHARALRTTPGPTRLWIPEDKGRFMERDDLNRMNAL